MKIRAFLVLAMGALSAAAIARQTVTVFAAASLKDAFSELARKYERRYPGTKVVFQFAGSQQLAAQIQQGAQADVFASADPQQIKVAIGRGGAEFARNKLVIIVSRWAAGKVPTYAELADPGLKIVVGVHDVPVGFYTEQVLRRLAGHQVRNWAPRVGANIVSRETDVKSILAKVELGEADAGIVYVTDAKSAGDVVSRPIPDRDNALASYRVASVSRSPDARRFTQFVLSREGRITLMSYGFLLPAG